MILFVCGRDKIQLEFLLEILSSKSYEYFIYSKTISRYGGVEK